MADKIIVGSTVYAEPHDPDELWQDVYIQIRCTLWTPSTARPSATR